MPSLRFLPGNTKMDKTHNAHKHDNALWTRYAIHYLECGNNRASRSDQKSFGFRWRSGNPKPPAASPASSCNGRGGVGGAVQLHRFISFTFPGRIKPPPRPSSVMKRVGYRETEEAAWFEYISLHHSAPLRPRQFQSLAHTRPPVD